MLNFEDVEDRDGERDFLSLPDVEAYRISRRRSPVMERMAIFQNRSYAYRGPHLSVVHTFETAGRPSTGPLRTSHLQTSLSRSSQSILVCLIILATKQKGLMTF